MRFNFKQLFFVMAMMMHAIIIAQKVEAINKKGTIVRIHNNQVTTSSTPPVDPVENDVWFDNSDSDNTRPKIWNGTTWGNLSYTGSTGSVFYTGADNLPNQDNDNLFWDENNKRLGVGTNSPDVRLDVNGTTKIRNLPAGAASDQLVVADTNGNLKKLPISNLETKTTITQNNTTGIITHTSEDGTLQTVKVVSTNANNSIAAGSDGGAYLYNPIKAFGKYNAFNSTYYGQGIASVSKLNDGKYRVTMTNSRADANYTVQLTVMESSTAEIDIYVASQTPTTFDVHIRSNVIILQSFVDRSFHFTVLE
ncbi:hypothetical protein ACNR9Q_05020 [Maribacter sp. X9]|uniref:hypothetical protein n=1 Tax=Maribacter sp. X9 TaxID=3402159 RepID=UPI003AF3C2B2